MADTSTLTICVGDKNFPFLSRMYDPTDPDHTVGDRDYFEDQLDDAIDGCNLSDYNSEVEWTEKIELLQRERAALEGYDRVIVYG